MKRGNDFIWKTLRVVSWIIFVGLCIESGTLLFNFVYSLFKPSIIEHIPIGMNLTEIYEHSLFHYICFVSFLILLGCLKATVFYFVIKIFAALDPAKPFSTEIADLIRKISYSAFVIGLGSAFTQAFSKHLVIDTNTGGLETFKSDGSAFLMMAAILFVIAQIFKKGIDLQNENDLTV